MVMALIWSRALTTLLKQLAGPWYPCSALAGQVSFCISSNDDARLIDIGGNSMALQLCCYWSNVCLGCCQAQALSQGVQGLSP